MESGISVQYYSLPLASTQNIISHFVRQTSCYTRFALSLNPSTCSKLMTTCLPRSIPCSNALIFKTGSLSFPRVRNVIDISPQNLQLQSFALSAIFPSSAWRHIHYSRGSWVVNHPRRRQSCLCLLPHCRSNSLTSWHDQ